MDIILIGGLLFALLLFFYMKKQTVVDLNNPEDQELRAKYKFTVKPEQEKSIKIDKLYLYPMRGIMGIEVPALKVSKYGIKYDREWAIYEKDKLGCIT